MTGPNGAQPQPVSLGKIVGAGELMQPCPVSYTFTKVPAVPALYVLRVAHVTGVFAMALDEGDLRKFISRAQECLTGLVLPGPGGLGGAQ